MPLLNFTSRRPLLLGSIFGFSVLVSNAQFIVSSAWGEESSKFLLTETEVIRLAQNQPPASQLLESEAAQTKAAQLTYARSFEPRATINYSYKDSREDDLSAFQPTFGPVKNLSIGVKQNLKYGTEVGVEAFSSQMSSVNGTIDSATQTGARASLSLDLWRNFLGRVDRAQLSSLDAQAKRALLRKKVLQSAFEIDVRKLYWALVSNQEALEFSRRMVETAEIQLKDAERRRRAGDADAGDFARSEAQLQSRRAAVTLFEYKREQLLYELRKLLPDLKSQDITLPQPDFTTTLGEILACVKNVATKDASQAARYSPWSEIVTLLTDEYNSERKLARSAGDMNVKLISEVQTSGVANSHTDAYDEFRDDGKSGYAVGIAVSIPLGSSAREQERTLGSAVENRFTGERRRIEREIEEKHGETLRSIRLLQAALATQGDSVSALSRSLKSTQAKYRQARVSINSVVLEQDAMFNSAIQEIDTRLTVINVLFDYFKVFTDFPCKINHAGGSAT